MPLCLRIDGDQVTLQVFQNTRGISTGDHVTFLNRQMQAIYGDALLGRRLSGAGDPIDGGPEIMGEAINIGTPSFNPVQTDHSARFGADQYPDDRCLQLPCQIAKNSYFFRRRRAL